MPRRGRRLDAKQRRDHCRTGKRRWLTWAEAHLAMLSARNHREATGEHQRVEQRAYECEFCHGWHLTSQDVRRT